MPRQHFIAFDFTPSLSCKFLKEPLTADACHHFSNTFSNTLKANTPRIWTMHSDEIQYVWQPAVAHGRDSTASRTPTATLRHLFGRRTAAEGRVTSAAGCVELGT